MALVLLALRNSHYRHIYITDNQGPDFDDLKIFK
jgi:hypothetical protein